MVMEMSRSGPTPRNMRIRFGRSARTVGSPPVTFSERTPRFTKTPRSLVSSSNVSSSDRGSQVSPSAGMQ